MKILRGIGVAIWLVVVALCFLAWLFDEDDRQDEEGPSEQAAIEWR